MAVQQTMTISLGGRPFRLVIFDMDGVLVSTSASHAQAYDELWLQLGFDGPDYDSIAGRKTGEVVAEVTAALQPSTTQIEEWTLQKQRRARELIFVGDICYPDVATCLKEFSATGTVLALGTAASGETAGMVLDRYGFSDVFAAVVTAEDVIHGKPAPDIYQQIMTTLEMPASATLIVEDSLSGLQSALLAGACAVSVRTGIRVDSEKFIRTFNDLDALTQAIRAGQ
jgi:beta-phosphoglucomutase